MKHPMGFSKKGAFLGKKLVDNLSFLKIKNEMNDILNHNYLCINYQSTLPSKQSKGKNTNLLYKFVEKLILFS